MKIDQLAQPHRYPGLRPADFLYGDDTPWPVKMHPGYEGVSPAIIPVPAAEKRDWETYVDKYYIESVVEFSVASAAAALATAVEHRSDYPDLNDGDFTHLMCEGLYSKYLSPLDPRDAALFHEQIVDTATYNYLKCDFTAMRVVKALWPGEAAAASILLVRRRKDDTAFAYQVVAIVLQVWNPARGVFDQSEVLRPQDGEAWRVARYFVLQGAIHRINLIDHPGVHFPADTINALTKSVLPKTNLIVRLLQPHMWLSLPVDNAVLEGQKSIINMNKWFPWCPFVAKGSEARKLLPFFWAGSQFYAVHNQQGSPNGDAYFDIPNDSYKAFHFTPAPPEIASHYGEFLRGYFVPIRKFTRAVVDHMSNTEWREAGFWAEAIAQYIPGHPEGARLIGADGKTFDKDLLADLLAHFIWNAAVMHSSDHESLHEMYESLHDAKGTEYKAAMPVPFILRVTPPLTRDYVRQAVTVAGSKLSWMERMERWAEHLANNTPLSWPSDNMSSHLADQMFYKPHNSLCLADVGVAASGDGNRSYIGFDTPGLAGLVKTFHAELVALDTRLRATDSRQHVVALNQMACSVQY